MPLQLKHRLQHPSAVTIARLSSSDGTYCLSGCNDKLVRLWNSLKGTQVAEYSGHGWPIADLCISPDNARFATCGGDKQVFYWDVLEGVTLRRFSAHLQRVNAVAMNFDGSVVASGSFDTKVHLWDCRSLGYQPIQTLKDAKDSISSIQIVQHEILVGSVDGFFRIYDLRMAKMIEDFVGFPVTCASLSSDQQCVLVSSLDSSIRLFDKQNGTLLNT